MESKVSEILENILGMLGLEGSFEVVEEEEEVKVTIDTEDPGMLIGYRGETLDALQLLINQIVNKQAGEAYKRVIIDIAGWRKSKEEDLLKRAEAWAEEVKESGKQLELEPMPSWQRRIIHLAISEVEGVESESVGEGFDRHLVIRPEVKVTKGKKSTKEKTVDTKAEEKVEEKEETKKLEAASETDTAAS